MNLTRLVAAAAVSWLAYICISFLVHAVLLKDIYLQHIGRMRPEEEASAILPIGFGFALIGFLAFAYAYAKGYEGTSGVREGLRFGLIVGVLLCCFGAIWDYMVWPVSPALAALWMVDFIVEFALYGVIVGAIYRPAPRAAGVAAPMNT